MRIAQITDFHLRHNIPGSSHITDRQCRYIQKLLPDTLKYIAQQNVDLIAITGDLVDAPDQLIEENKPTNEILADYKLVKQLLDDSNIPYMPLSGNHDLESAFWQVFDPRKNETEIASHRIIRFSDREHEKNIPKRVGQQRTLFNQTLSDKIPTPQIHLQHYVITPTLNESYPHTYADGQQLADQITKSNNIPLCLSGHYHRGVKPILINNTTFATCPAFCVSPFPWRVYDIIKNKVTTHNCELLTHHKNAAK